MTNNFYPKSGRYFAQLTAARPIFQGDVFHGGFGVWRGHPAALKAILAGKTVPSDSVCPTLRELTTIRREVRTAALSRVAWRSLADRPSRYFVGIPLDTGTFALVQGHLHSDVVDKNDG